MRLFVALDIDDSIGERMARFIDGVREFAPDARWVRVESLHITLKFIGEKSPEWAEELKQALNSVHCSRFQLGLRGYGFFPSPKAARVFWIVISAGEELARLAADIDGVTSQLGVAKEEHAFSPHLTLARGGKTGAPRRQKSDGSNTKFKRLQEKLAALPAPDFGTMTAREYFLYQSKVGPGGSQYTKMAKFELT
jgi:RNA 2',3'-cyclic 3'-phosphodiesterase